MTALPGRQRYQWCGYTVQGLKLPNHCKKPNHNFQKVRNLKGRVVGKMIGNIRGKVLFCVPRVLTLYYKLDPRIMWHILKGFEDPREVKTFFHVASIRSQGMAPLHTIALMDSKI